MHSYPHNIKTFNSATRHLTRVERSLYRDLIELYYDTEQPLPAVDFDRLARRVMANTEEEIAALQFVLGEFFELTGDVYTHDFCDEQIDKFHASTTAKALAGKASAAARKKKTDDRKKKRSAAIEQNSTDAEQPLNDRSTEDQQNPTNQEPITNNQEQSLKDIPPEEKPPAETPKKPKRKSRLPDDFVLTDHLRGLAIEHWKKCERPDLDPDYIFAGFLAGHRSKGTVMLDWNQAWTTWYMNAVKFNPAPKGQNHATNQPNREDRSAVGRVHAANVEASRRREEALQSGRAYLDDTGAFVEADDGAVRTQVDQRLRGVSQSGMGAVIDGDYTRDDQAGFGTNGR